jgi:hypothetical protein
MNKYLKYSIGLFVLVGIGTYFARTLGFYNTYWFTDVILHTISGVAFGFLMLSIIGKEKISRKLEFFILIGFAVFGSYVWEVWEFSGFHIMPGVTEFYTPELGDSLGDIACGMLGAILLSILRFLKSLKGKKY